MSPKAKKIIGWVLAGLMALMAIASAFGKFTADPSNEMGQLYVNMGVYDNRFLIGSLEIFCAVMLLIPRTSTIGVVLSAGYWGGAAATDLTHGQFPGVVLVFWVVLGLIALLRNPELFTRLRGKEIAS
jgi:hypothetical protein